MSITTVCRCVNLQSWERNEPIPEHDLPTGFDALLMIPLDLIPLALIALALVTWYWLTIRVGARLCVQAGAIGFMLWFVAILLGFIIVRIRVLVLFTSCGL